MKEDIYQEINFIYKASITELTNYSSDVSVKLVNDYDLYDVFESFIYFCTTIDFRLNNDEVMERLKSYIDENMIESSDK